MSRRLDADIDEWAQDVVANMNKSGFSGINTVEKLLKDPGLSTQGSRHRVLYWPKNRRIAKMSRVMHQIDKVSQIVLIISCGYLSNDDHTVFTKHNLAKCSSLGVRRFNELEKLAKIKLSQILMLRGLHFT